MLKLRCEAKIGIVGWTKRGTSQRGNCGRYKERLLGLTTSLRAAEKLTMTTRSRIPFLSFSHPATLSFAIFWTSSEATSMIMGLEFLILLPYVFYKARTASRTASGPSESDDRRRPDQDRGLGGTTRRPSS